MSLYGTERVISEQKAAESNTILEAFFVDDIIRQRSDEIKKFTESSEAQVLVEKQVLKKPTLMRLSKQDDKKRRIKLIAYQLAKDANDPEWTKLKKYTKLRKESIAKIMQKYGAKAARMAEIAQKNYIATAKKVTGNKEAK